MRNEFTAIFKREGDWYIAHCPEIPGLNGQGQTKEEARANLTHALALILEGRRRDALSSMSPDAEHETVAVYTLDLVPRTQDQFYDALESLGVMTNRVEKRQNEIWLLVSSEGDGSYADLVVRYGADGYVEGAILGHYWHSWFMEERSWEPILKLSRSQDGLIEIGVKPGLSTEVVFVRTTEPISKETQRLGSWHFCWTVISRSDAVARAEWDPEFRALFDFQPVSTDR